MSTMNTDQSGSENRSLPPAGEHVVVHCPGFSCLGYLDEDGTWKSVFTNKPLSDVINFSPIA